MSIFEKKPEPAPSAEAATPAAAGDDVVVQTINYRKVSSKTADLEWTRIKNDYLYQWRSKVEFRDQAAVTQALLMLLDEHLPTCNVEVMQPDPGMGVFVFTLRVNDIGDRPGAEKVMEHVLIDELLKLDVSGL